MKSLTGNIKEESSRDLYWTKITFLSDDEASKTFVFVCASQEYLMDYYRISGDEKIEQKRLNDWVSRVIARWSKLGKEILNQDVHYDVYATTQEGEANGLDFLLGKARTS